MLRDLGRKNQLLALALFIWALGVGLWGNLQQLYLTSLGATPDQVGLVLALASLLQAVLMLPTGFAIDRFGSHRVMLLAWGLGIVGLVWMALAGTWPMLAVGMVINGIWVLAMPAISTYALAALPDRDLPGITERAFGTVFAAIPAGLIISPWIGGQIADRYSIRTDLWISFGLACVSLVVIVIAGHTHQVPAAHSRSLGGLLRNRAFVLRVIYYMVALFALMIFLPLAPNFLQDARGLPYAQIGLLFAFSYVGETVLNLLAGRIGSRWGVPLLMTAMWLALIGLWRVDHFAVMAGGFLALGGLWPVAVLLTAGIAHTIEPYEQGRAFSISETTTSIAYALASGLAGKLYTLDPGMPFLAEILVLPLILVLWFALRLWRTPTEETSTESISLDHLVKSEEVQ